MTAEYLRRWVGEPHFPDCPWAHSPLFPLFLLARNGLALEWLGEEGREVILRRLSALRRADGLWGKAAPEALDTSLAVLSHAMMGAEVGSSPVVAAFLLSCQLADGGWGWCPLFSDGQGTWFGHRAVSTLVAVRALEVLGLPPQSTLAGEKAEH